MNIPTLLYLKINLINFLRVLLYNNFTFILNWQIREDYVQHRLNVDRSEA
jgi:hypothetical protein